MDLSRVDWSDVETSLWQSGYAKLPQILSPEECASLIGLYARTELFRSRIEMARYRFGVGNYQYFDYPLPPVVQQLREQSYPPLAGVANRWLDALGVAGPFPDTLLSFLGKCHDAGQAKATPLLLHYEAGGYNCLHQDLYGDIAFPLQLVSLLSSPQHDFEGGDFLLVEQRPRAQSVGHAIHIARGEAVVFTTRYRPVKGVRGFYRVNVKHGVSPLILGTRYTLGIIYHDAR
ncbi:MAG: 2OG-Fe(II) oxygenase [Bryobacteraceae bacterium]